MAQGNNAYDFERFSRTPHKKLAVSQPPELRVVKSRQAVVDNSFWVYAALLFIAVLIIVAAVIYNNMKLTELTAQMEVVQKEYSTLQDDYKRMQVELEGKISTRTIEEIATTRLGMAKAEPYQIIYMDLGTSSQVLLSRQASPTPADRIKEALTPILEYITP